MSKPLPYLPLYVRDFLNDPDVVRLGWHEQGVYLRMLMASWEYGPLPDDPFDIGLMIDLPRYERELEALLSIFNPQEAIKEILAQFWVLEGGYWTSTRLEIERGRALQIISGRSNGGKNSVAARQRKSVQAQLEVSSNSAGVEPCQVEDKDQEEDQSKKEEEERSLAEPRPAVLKARKESSGPQAETIRAFEKVYSDARGLPFVFSKKHAVAIAACLKMAGGDMGEVIRRARILIETPPNDWYAQNATPAILASHWNELGQVVFVDPVEKERMIRENRQRERMRKAIERDEQKNRAALPDPTGRLPEVGTNGHAGGGLGDLSRGSFRG